MSEICSIFQCKYVVISNLQLRSGHQQHDVLTLIIGERSHGFLPVLNILAINLHIHANIINAFCIKSYVSKATNII